MVRRIVAADAVPAQGLAQPAYPVPVEHDAGRHDQPVVGDRIAVGKVDGVRVGVKGADACPDQGDARRHHRVLVAPRAFERVLAGPDERQGRLVVVQIGWLDDGDVKVAAALAQNGRDRDAGAAAPDDKN